MVVGVHMADADEDDEAAELDVEDVGSTFDVAEDCVLELKVDDLDDDVDFALDIDEVRVLELELDDLVDDAGFVLDIDEVRVLELRTDDTDFGLRMHLPLLHISFPSHHSSQLPQFLTSLLVSTQSPSHSS